MTDTAPTASPPSASSKALAAVAPFIVLAVFLAGFATFIGWPAWPVVDAGERVAYSAILAALLAAAAAWTRRSLPLIALHLLAAVVCLVPAMWPQYVNEVWSIGTLALWTVVGAYVVLRAARLTWGLAVEHGVLGWLVMLGMAASGGALLMSTGSLKLGQAGFALAAGVLVAFVAAVFAKSVRVSAGVPLIVMAILGTLLVSGHLWSELSLGAALCVMIAPLLAQVVRVPWVRDRPLWQRVVIGLAIAALPATAVTVPAAIAAQRASESVDENGY